jgi:hypothetical protein
MIKHGPVDVIVLAAGEPKLDGDVINELQRQASKGTIRVLDAMFLMKDDEGNRGSIDIEDLPEDLRASVGFIETGTRGLFDSRDAEMMWEGMVPGSAVFAVAIEHAWAVDLVNALADAGVELAFNYRVPAPIVDEALASLGKS